MDNRFTTHPEYGILGASQRGRTRWIRRFTEISAETCGGLSCCSCGQRFCLAWLLVLLLVEPLLPWSCWALDLVFGSNTIGPVVSKGMPKKHSYNKDRFGMPRLQPPARPSGLNIPQQPQRQDDVSSQLRDLVEVANRLGMYDAADWLKEKINGDANG